MFEAAPTTAIEEAAGATKEVGGGGPGDIIKVARDDDGAGVLFDLARYDEQFRIPFDGRGVLPRCWRAWMQAVEGDDITGRKDDAGADARHVLLDEVADLGVAERVAREAVHAVEVVQRDLDGVRARDLDAGQGLFPPGIGLEGEDDVGIVL
ncbi:MAG TPA: hypothetical protein PKN30_17015, partial [Flavobacteriales bacterium]|nr:hypothetical protein [Flavobacteriales bacterium]